MDSEAVANFAVIADGTAKGSAEAIAGGMEKVSEAVTISVVEKASMVADSSSTVALVFVAAKGRTAAASAEVKDPAEAASTVVQTAATAAGAAAIVAAVVDPVAVADRMAAGTDSPV